MTMERTDARSGTWATLAVLLCGQVMANVDTAIVNVAAPSIRDDLRATDGQLEFVLSGYLIAYAVLLTGGAKLADKYGYRAVYLAGVLVFTAASLWCGISASTTSLIAARLLQGVGAALLVAQVLTGIQRSFTGPARGRALAWFAVTLSTASIAGQMLGGALVTADLFGLGWRMVFLVNVPVGVLILALGFRALPAPDRRAGEVRIDAAGTAALAAALLLLIVPLVFGRDTGWAPWTWVSLGLVVPAVVLFAVVERSMLRRGRQTVLNFAALRTPPVRWGTVANVAAASTSFAVMFVVALYLQSGLHYTALESGLALTLWVIAFGAAGPLVARLSPARVPRLLAPGYAVLALGFLLLSAQLLLFGHNYVALVVLLGVLGAGLGLGFNSLVHTLTQAAPQEWAADISALLNTSTEVAAALGISVFGGLYLVLTHSGAPDSAVRALAVVAAALALTALAATFAAHRSTR